MKANTIFLSFFICVLSLSANAQNVQSTADRTSGGFQAGNKGFSNTFYGHKAGFAIGTTGSGNTFLGHFSGQANTTGSNNLFAGAQSGTANTTGEANIFLGPQAGISNTTGSRNIFLGEGVGYYGSSGSENLLIGSQVQFNGAGLRNTIIGNYAGSDNSGSDNIFVGYTAGLNEPGSNKLYIDVTDTATPLIWGDFSTDQLKLNGKVGIGGVTSFPTTVGGVGVSSYMLFVKGGILTEEVRVSTAPWADYVFAKDYNLPTLTEVENHIKQKGHLINVPSAKQIAEEGIALGKMANIQQEKIEELTLYIIEQNKINEKQAAEINELKEKMNLLLNKK